MEYSLLKAFIDLDAIQKNIQNLKLKTDKKVLFMAVVKANAYGHGAVKIAEKAMQSGADWLGVARINEAVELRNAGINAPVLVFGYVHPSQAGMVKDFNLAVTVYDLNMAKSLSFEARMLKHPITVHLKVDTGMGRVGMVIDKNTWKKVIKEIAQMVKLPGIDFKGIYTHFAAADGEDRTHTDLQVDLFTSLLDDLKKEGIEFDICHAANSAGIIDFPLSHFDMVRAGISLYGLYPSNKMNHTKVKLFPALSLKSIVTGVKTVPKGFYVSYGRTYKTRKQTRLASVPVGYADGFSRRFSSNCNMLVKGYKVPVVGRVCMDQTLIDVGDIPGITPGCEVVLIGSQGKEMIGADELADRINTINYEIVSALMPRVERIYSDSGSGSG